MVVGTIISMKTAEINGRRATSVKVNWEVSDDPKDVTCRIANTKFSEMIDQINEDSEQDNLPKSVLESNLDLKKTA